LLVVLHGFTQGANAWGPFGDLLAQNHRVLAIDLPGHGGSADIEADLEGTANAVLETVGDRRFDLLGYSLGGRVALTLALRSPEHLDRLVLIGATAGIDDPDERAARFEADAVLAKSIIEEDDVDAFLGRWLSQPIFADLDDESALRSERLVNYAPGLASSLRLSGTGCQEPSWHRLGSIRSSSLVLAGERDEKFTALGRRLADAIPHGTFRTVEGAGHACHLAAPGETAAILEDWFQRP
jgi:2-succinyl-6-hydroxy-2,4-cyclohexadiene-1-carboxylate synthase